VWRGLTPPRLDLPRDPIGSANGKRRAFCLPQRQIRRSVCFGRCSAMCPVLQVLPALVSTTHLLRLGAAPPGLLLVGPMPPDRIGTSAGLLLPCT
jgi:hypothetical protein